MVYYHISNLFVCACNMYTCLLFFSYKLQLFIKQNIEMIKKNGSIVYIALFVTNEGNYEKH